MQLIIRKEQILNPMLTNKTFGISLIVLSIFLSFIENFYKIRFLIGGWHIVFYILLTLPLLYATLAQKLINPYTKWFLPFLFIMIVDMFYYNNTMVQYFVPIIFYILLFVLYITAMQKVHSVYQTFIPHFFLSFNFVKHIKDFFTRIFTKKPDAKLYTRIALALSISLPFVGIFLALLFDADSNYSYFIRKLFDFHLNFSIHYLVSVPLYFILFLWLFIYGFSNEKDRIKQTQTQALDLLIVGIFLGLINLVFISFILMQIPFLIDSQNVPQGINIASFAREGFFQLMLVMGLVVLIFLFIMRRFKNEKLVLFFLVGLLVQSIIMGIVSLKKMYLYQSIKGATVLRYYVEWFDYFLISVLFLSIIFLIKKYPFAKLLNIVTFIAIISFSVIISLNIDAIVAKHNIEKFKNTPQKLDRYALYNLSIDALPILKQSNIKLTQEHKGKFYSSFYKKRNCNNFASYHFGYCSIEKVYGNKKTW